LRNTHKERNPKITAALPDRGWPNDG
jgi:hypothetical protein